MKITILRYTKPASIGSMQHADSLHPESFKVADVDDKWTLNDSFIEKVNSSISRNLRKY